MPIRREHIVLLAAAMVVLAALVGREFPRMGFWLACLTAAGYLLVGMPGTVKRLRAIRRIGAMSRLKALSAILLAATLAQALIRGGSFGYVSALLLLAFDYFYCERQRS